MPASPGIDAQGNPDPSENVKALTEAAVVRLDDLMALTAKYTDRHFATVAYYEDKLRDAEAKRLNAIRDVDVGNVDRAAREAIERANTLAGQVTATATAFDAKLAAALDPIIKDIADLRRVQYEGVGSKTQVVEARDAAADNKPILDAIAALVKAEENRAGGQQQVATTKDNTRLTATLIGAVLSTIGIASFLLSLKK